MNQRGDVPVMILVIGVIAICGLAIFSFITAKKISDESSLEEGLYLFEQIYSDLEKFEFYSNSEVEFKGDAVKMINAKIIENSLIIEKEDGGIKIRYEKDVGLKQKRL